MDTGSIQATEGGVAGQLGGVRESGAPVCPQPVTQGGQPSERADSGAVSGWL
jgi:hypothetical protein